MLERYIELKNQDIENADKWESRIEEIAGALNDLHPVDPQHRITIKKDTMECLNWQGNSQIIFDGLGTSLSIKQKK